MKARMSQITKRPAKPAGLLLLACLFASTAFAQLDGGLGHCNQQQLQSGQGGGGGGCPQQLKQIKQLASQPAPQSLPVTVQNTPNVNVTNTASVTVANTPSVSVTNTPSVNVANTPSVTLESGASVAVTSPVDGQGNPTPIAVLDAFQPYEDECIIAFNGLTGGSCAFQPIPSGKQLVIQEFDAFGQIETGLKPYFALLTSWWVYHYFPATFMNSAYGIDTFVTNAETRLYAPASYAPGCSVYLTANSYQYYNCQLSGYLVDMPEGGSDLAAPKQHHQHPPLSLGRNPGRHANN